jgi:hypothetical protein
MTCYLLTVLLSILFSFQTKRFKIITPSQGGVYSSGEYFWQSLNCFDTRYLDDPCPAATTAVGTTGKWCLGLQGMAGSRSWRTRSASRTWADAGLEPHSSDVQAALMVAVQGAVPAKVAGELQPCCVRKASTGKFADGPLTHRSSHAMSWINSDQPSEPLRITANRPTHRMRPGPQSLSTDLLKSSIPLLDLLP